MGGVGRCGVVPAIDEQSPVFFFAEISRGWVLQFPL
jgi:hypothetical protein